MHENIDVFRGGEPDRRGRGRMHARSPDRLVMDQEEQEVMEDIRKLWQELRQLHPQDPRRTKAVEDIRKIIAELRDSGVEIDDLALAA